MIKDEQEVYGFLALITLPLWLLSSLWNTYIVWDICTLYGLTYLTQYGYEVFFGSWLILGLAKTKLRDMQSSKSTKESFNRLINYQMSMLLFWGMAHLYHYLLRF